MIFGIAEKTYRAKHKRLMIDRPVPTSQKKDAETAIERSLGTLFDRTRAEIARSIETGHIDVTGKAEKAGTFCAMHGYMEVPAERAADFARRLQGLIEEMGEEKEAPEAAKARYGFTFTFYPSPGVDEKAPRGKSK
jgi:hypothetical protein